MNKYILLFLIAALFASCNDWLDITPKDKQLERDMFATEFAIQNATTGLYRGLIKEDLYGGRLSQTTVEVMGHAYTYPTSQPSNDAPEKRFFDLANFTYTSTNTQGDFSSIWSSAYTLLLEINNYIKGVEESTAVIDARKKNMLLGEAYGLRAYLHFDLFRLYGPAWQDRTGAKILPYHNYAQVTINHVGYEESMYSTADEFMTLLLEDIEAAKTLLEGNDPIIDDAESITIKEPSSDFYKNRNRRMNYYAVKGLEARVRQYRGEDDLAAQAAKVVTDRVGERFTWVDPSKVVSYFDYVFFSEVIFGINNLDMSSQRESRYEGNDIRTMYMVNYDHLFNNVLGYGGATSLNALGDIRSRQWKLVDYILTYPAVYPASALVYKSARYNGIPSNSENQSMVNLQPLMRISEMYYIQAEAALKAGQKGDAIQMLNNLTVQHRSVPDELSLPDGATDAEVQAHIEKEYYREFFGEGQVFFYHKRRGSTTMFKGNGEGTVAVSPASFVVPIPDSEKNI